MSTRSYILIELGDGKYKGVYCHSDGYITHNGAILLDHYKEREKVEKLIELGDMSILAPEIFPNKDLPHSFNFNERQEGVCVFYGRDRGEKDVEAREVLLESLDSDNSWIEYVYVFSLNNEWKYFVCGRYSETGLLDLQDCLDIEYEALGFKRPEGYYGYYTDEDIKYFKSLEKDTNLDI